MEATDTCEQVYEGELRLRGHSPTKHIPAGLKRDFHPTSSSKLIFALFSEGKLRTFLVLHLKLRTLLLDSASASFDHMVYGDVARLKWAVSALCASALLGWGCAAHAASREF